MERMMNAKQILFEKLTDDLKQYENLIVECADISKGDFTIPCFSLAKELHKAPSLIAEELAPKFECFDVVQKVEAVNGYVNIFLNREIVAQKTLDCYDNDSENMWKTTVGKSKTICIDYSSANLAKYLHIGHLSTTILGECLARLFETQGYKVVRINFVGDYGTPFGKIVSAYKLWGSKQDVETRGVDAIQDLYVQFCKHEGEEYYDNLARETFKKIEQKDPEIMEIYNWILDISLEYNKKATEALGVKFDDFNGESYYNDKMGDVIKLLKDAKLLKDGEGGSKIVELDDLGVALIQKSDGTSLYTTRDLAAAMDRHKKYNFDKNYYVTDVAQRLHFDQVFKILELLNFDYAKNCQHIYYGRIRLPEGKISSRLGKQALIDDIVSEAVQRAKEVIKDRDLPNADEVARVVGLGATVFTVTKNEKIKDTTFDLNEALKFDGETSPYMQYTYARLASILRKADAKKNISNRVFEPKYLANDDAYMVLKVLCDFGSTIKTATEKLEPNIISKTVMNLCKLINKFYTNQKVLTQNADETFTKCKLIRMAKEAIKFGLNLLCINTVEVM